jgi:hypothetical protein
VVEETGEVMVEGTGEVMVEGLWVVVVGVWGQQDLDQAHQDRGRVYWVQHALQAPLCPRPRQRLRMLRDPAPLRGFQVFGCLYRCFWFWSPLPAMYYWISTLCEFMITSFEFFSFAHLKHLK